MQLNSCTGIEMIFIAVRGEEEHYNAMSVLCTSQRVGNFIRSVFKCEPEDFASRLEHYCLSGLDGEVYAH